MPCKSDRQTRNLIFQLAKKNHHPCKSGRNLIRNHPPPSQSEAGNDIRIAGDNHHNGLYFSSIYYAAHNTSSKEMQA